MTDDTHRKPLELVFETTDDTQLAFAKSVLDDAEIAYSVQGDEALGLFPLGDAGHGMFGHGMAAMIRVHEDKAADARELLRVVANEGADGQGGGTSTDGD